MPSLEYNPLQISSAPKNAYAKVVIVLSHALDFQVDSNPQAITNIPTDYVYLAAGETCDCESDSSDDTSAGVGARSLRIFGLDTNFLEIEEDIDLDGTNTVTTTKNFLRVHRALVLSAGSSQRNQGIITVTFTSTSAETARIEAGVGISMNSHYTVPANRNLLLTGSVINAAVPTMGPPAGMVDAWREIRPPNGVFYEFGRAEFHIPEQSIVQLDSDLGELIPGKSDIVVLATTNLAGVDIRVKQTGVLFDNKNNA